jgi:hypothetical protein
MLVRLRHCVFAALPHPTPYVVRGRSGQTVAQVCRELFAVAATGFRPTINKVGALASDLGSAGACAAPNSPSFWASANVLKGCEPAKLLPSKIAQCHWRNSTTNTRCIVVWNRTKERRDKCVEAIG